MQRTILAAFAAASITLISAQSGAQTAGGGQTAGAGQDTSTSGSQAAGGGQTSGTSQTPAGGGATATPSGPIVGYVKHVKPPSLIDYSPGVAVFGMIGVAAAISSGQEIVQKDGIEDPGAALAKEIAAEYAAAHGGQLADAPILSDKELTRASPADLAKASNGARYVVDVDPPGLTIIYFSFDWGHYDVMYLDVVRIIDTSDNKIVASGKCLIKTVKAPDLPTHPELLADNGAKLKAVIAAKSEACLAKLKSDLKL